MNKAKIDAVQTVIVDLPLIRTQQFSRVGVNQQSSVIVRIRTDQGVEGIGEAVTPCGPWWSGDSVETIKLTIDKYLTPLLLGETPLEPGLILEKLHNHVPNNSFAKAGLEIALLDCAGKLLQTPIHAMLGGKLRSSLEVAWPLATGEVARDVAEAESMLESRRARAFKIKMGALPPDEDMARAISIATKLEGTGAKIRVDPNEAWDEGTANRALGPLADAGVELIEQPVPRWNIDAMARLAARSRCVIMMDEGVQSTHDMIDVVKRSAAGLISLKLMKSGGIRAARVMADIANAAGIPAYVGTFLETSIGTAANMHLAASLAELPFGGEPIGPLLMAEDICTVPADYHDYNLWLPEGPGLGIELDMERLKHFQRNH